MLIAMLFRPGLTPPEFPIFLEVTGWQARLLGPLIVCNGLEVVIRCRHHQCRQRVEHVDLALPVLN